MIIAHLGAPWRTFALRRDPQGCQQFSMLDTLPARFKRTRQVPVVGGEAAISGTDGSLVVCKGVGDRLALELLIGPPRAARHISFVNGGCGAQPRDKRKGTFKGGRKGV